MKTSHRNMNPKSSPTLGDRDASFSTHLRPDQLNKYEQHHTIHPGRFTAPGHDSSTPELSIFNAHKYFNEVTNNNSSNSRVSPLVNMNSEHKHNPERARDITKTSRSHSFASSSVDGHTNARSYRAHSFHAATPTASSSSEASCHSQACLVSHLPTSAVSVSTTRNYPPHPHNPKTLKKKIRASWSKHIWPLRRKCPCSCKKSVQVNETTPNPKPKTPITTPPQPQPQPPSLNPTTPTITNKLEKDHNEAVNSQRFQPAMNIVRRPFTEGFSFPALATTTTSPHSRKHVLNVVQEEDPIPPRQSLEVFQPTVDRDYRRQNLPSPPSPKSRAMDVDDAASDASSDLFEIESFSTQAATVTCPIMAPAVSECHGPKHAASVDLCLAGDTKSSTPISGSECVAAVVAAPTSTTTAL